MPKNQVALLGVKHPITHDPEATKDAFRELPIVLKTLDKQITALDKPVVGLEIKPQELGVYLMLAENPQLARQAKFKKVLEAPFQKFWFEVFSHPYTKAFSLNRNIEFVALDSGALRNYTYKKYPTPKEQKIMKGKTVGAQKLREHFENAELFAVFARDSVKEAIGVRRVKEHGVNIVIAGAGHMEGYKQGLPQSRIVYRYSIPKNIIRLDNRIRKIYRYALNRMQRGLHLEKVPGSKAPARKPK